jgi:tyrosine-protein phosphatase SIW14
MRYQPLLLALALVFVPACSKAPAKRDTPSRPATAEMPIVNFAKVADGVYRGAQPDEAGFKALKGLGVKTVVNLRNKHDDTPAAKPLGIEVVQIPMAAKMTIAPPTDAEVKTFLDAVLDPARRPVFVHCAGGKDRTGTMCAIYRMEVDHWTPEKAYEEMKSFGWHDDMYPALGKFVLGYKPHLVAGRAGK